MKTMKRAGLAAVVIVVAALLIGVWVLTHDLFIPRNEKGRLDLDKTAVRSRDKDQLFAFLGNDITAIDLTVRQVDYSYLNETTEAKTDQPAPAPKAAPAPESAPPAVSKTGPVAAPAAPPPPEPKPPIEERKLSLARVDGKWMLTAPLHAQADQGAADGLASAIAELRVRGTAEGADPFDPQYGLDNPCVIADVTLKNRKHVKFLLGRDTTVGSDLYLALEGGETLYYASSSVKTSLVKEPKDLRDKKVAEFDDQAVRRLVLDAGGSRVVCEQSGRKDAREWWLTQPVNARAQDFSISDLVSAVKSLEAKDFVDNVQSTSAYGLDKPTVVVRLDFGKDKDDIVVRFGRRTKQSTEPDSMSTGATGSQELVYCQTDGRDEIFLVDASALDKLSKKPIDLRDRGVIDYQTVDVIKVEIDRTAGLDVTFEKGDGKWRISRPQVLEADTVKVDNLLYDIKGVEAADFLDNQTVAPGVSGLDKPDITVRVTLQDKQKRTSVKELKFGRLAANRIDYYCQSSDLPGPVLVGPTHVEKLPMEIESYKKAPPPTSTPSGDDTSTGAAPPLIAPPPPMK